MGVTVRTASGLVEGTTVEGVHAFLGMPYAAPPFGEHRFAAPAPPQPWEGVRPAVAHGPAAPQAASADIGLFAPDAFVVGEDCLHLDVFTPDPGAAGLPVLVWIHGGAFSIGATSAAWHQGHRFARDGVVCVAINYRLGFEGFLAMQDAPLNRGVLDWLAALEWVRDNVAAFGGDPSRVTIAGQSAGGAAVATLMAMPRAAGLFHRAIVMSGSATLVATREDAEAYAKELAARLGVSPTRQGFAALSPQVLVEAQPPPLTGQAGGLNESVPLKPVVDGVLVTGPPLHALRADVPLLAGRTSQEADVFVRRAGYDEATAAAVTEHLFGRETQWIIEARPAAATYEFRWESPVESPVGGGRVGAVHNLDLPFAFDLLDAPGVARTAGEPPQMLADAMHGTWVRFVGGEELPDEKMIFE